MKLNSIKKKTENTLFTMELSMKNYLAVSLVVPRI